MPKRLQIGLQNSARRNALRDFNNFASTANELDRLCASASQTNQRLLSQISAIVSLNNQSISALLSATERMQEMQMSLNLQWLQLQNSMQNESREFTVVSNIMKTKHDTVKNSISNLR
ncbi:MAG TPA: hypothetical protein VE779_00310 [Candidatus Angelobacter sp.]|jgi:hypothetical protein|nr:hypothetical protein [Candidatus Angelobacter sp.]